MFKKILFRLHIRNSYPSYLTGLDGSKVPCNIIRTDGKSYNIRPDIPRRPLNEPYSIGSENIIHFNRWAPKDKK